MKDSFIVIIIIVVLSIVFSIFGPFFPLWTTNGLNPKQLGNRGMALPTGGNVPAELAPETSEYEMHEQSNTDISKSEPGMLEYENEIDENAESELTGENEKGRNMNEIVVAFWHGVGAVLIGETCALALASFLIAKMSIGKKALSRSNEKLQKEE